MENVLLAGVCPSCYAYVMLAPSIRESEVITCGDCRTPLVVEHVSATTASLARTPEIILL